MGFIENAKEVVELVQKIDNIDLVKKILELQTDALDLVEEKRVLQERVRELEDQQRTAGELEFRRNAWWRGDAAYCTACWDQKKTLVRLHDQKDGERWKCPGCGWSDYQGQEGRELANRRFEAIQEKASAQNDWDPFGH